MTGFNTEVKHRGAAFHVQTQDVGSRAQYVESSVYKSGKLLATRKTYYTSFLGSPDVHQKIQRLMEDQHNAILKDIADGKFDHYLTPQEKKAGS
ncbi:MAG: hypothetical protein QHH14_11125 [Clostridiales bacterium]|nr:hypothetical protein [Clostridiales bacterium]